MKKEFIYGIVGVVAGLLITLIVVYKSAPSLMLVEDESKYDFNKTVEVFEKEVKDAKWKVAGIHDMQKILAGFGHDVEAIKIFELCSSRYSKTILDLDDERIVSPLMPCRVAVYEKSDGKTYITRMNNSLMAKPFGGVINDVMQKAAGETEVFINKIIK